LQGSYFVGIPDIPNGVETLFYKLMNTVFLIHILKCDYNMLCDLFDLSKHKTFKWTHHIAILWQQCVAKVATTKCHKLAQRQ